MTFNKPLEDFEVKFDPEPPKQKVSSFYRGGQVGIIIDLITQLDIENQLVLLHFLAGSFGFTLKEKQ